MNPVHVLQHRRLVLFWLVALIGLVGPWMIVGGGDRPGWWKGLTAVAASGGQLLENCRVLSIYDGDTMTVRCRAGPETKVRFHCIDTPEMGQKPWGERARDHLRAAAGDVVSVRVKDRDRYGRTVGEVIAADGTVLNLAQVRAGWAAVYRRYCSDDRYPTAEAQAKAARQGIWATPGIHQTPWDYRRQ